MNDQMLELSEEEAGELQWLLSTPGMAGELARIDANRGGVLAHLACRLALQARASYGGGLMTVDSVPAWALAFLVGAELPGAPAQTAGPATGGRPQKTAGGPKMTPEMRKRVSDGVKAANARKKAAAAPAGPVAGDGPAPVNARSTHSVPAPAPVEGDNRPRMALGDDQDQPTHQSRIGG